jgi:hypothetical protein
MVARVYYLRDKKNIHIRPNGLPTRGNPIACVVSEIDRENDSIKYSFSIAHPATKTCPGERFDKAIARKIATNRLVSGLDRCTYSIVGCPKGGHDINRKVMAHIAANTTAKSLRDLAAEWLRNADAPRPVPVSRA